MKLRRGQKCWECKKEIKGDFCFNGHYWDKKCWYKELRKRVNKYLENDGCSRCGFERGQL